MELRSYQQVSVAARGVPIQGSCAWLTCRSFGLESCPLAFFALVAFGLLCFAIIDDLCERTRDIGIESDSACTRCGRLAVWWVSSFARISAHGFSEQRELAAAKRRSLTSMKAAADCGAFLLFLLNRIPAVSALNAL